MNRSPSEVVADRVICGPEREVELAAEAGSAAPVLEVVVLVPVDLSASHGVDVTLTRLQEMAAAYDPSIEMAALNFDHAWGGPSLGWCQSLELRGEELWATYVDLDPDAVEAIRARRYTRQSAEFVLEHSVTDGWYFTGLALLGNARPAVSGLPPVTLYRPVFKEIAMDDDEVVDEDLEEEEEVVEEEDDSTEEPEPDTASLRGATQEALRLVASLRTRNAELEAERVLSELGARATPAIRRLAAPLLVALLAGKPQKIKLAGPKGRPVELTLFEALVQLLKALPEFQALNAGELAVEEPEEGLAEETGLDSKRLRELNRKYRFASSYGFQRRAS